MSEIVIPKAFRELFQPSRYKAYFGGRGSGKSHSIAAALIVMAAQKPLRVLCAREVQKSIKDSVKRLLDDKIAACGLSAFYESIETEIRGKNGSLFVFAGLKTNPDSIKSMEGIDIAWVEEASRVSQRSLDLLIPTVRKPESELWFSWNPEAETDPVDVMFRVKTPPNAVVRRVTWADNPFFPEVLKAEMEHDKATDPDKWAHVWEGEYRKAVEGAYYAKHLADAESEGRIGNVAADPVVQKRAFWDIGTSDSTAIWVAQFVGREIRVLDYIEGQGQPLGYYLNELRSRGHDALCVLPHDGAHRDHFTAVSYADHVQAGGFRTEVVKNQGRQAAMQRIEAARRLFGQCWFDRDRTRDGLKALGAYHERRDEHRNVGLGPEHDWSSHAADAFGLMAIAYEEPRVTTAPLRRNLRGIV